MRGSVPKLSGQNRLRSCDSSNTNVWSDDEEEENRNKMQDIDGKLKSMSIVPVFLEKKKKERPNNNSSEKKTPTGDNKDGKKKMCNEVKNSKTSATSFEKDKRKEKLKVSYSKKNMQTEEELETWTDNNNSKRRKVSTNSERFQRDKKYEKNVENGHYKVKSKKVSAASYAEDKKKKMQSHDNVNKKINGADKNTSLSFIKRKMQNTNGKKRTEPITYVVNEKKKPYESIEMKMQHNLKQKMKNVPSYMSKEKKTKAPNDSNYEKRKREESSILSKKVKRMHSDENKKIHSGKVKEKNCDDGKEKERNTHISFFKVIPNNFKESLSIPPSVAPELEDLANHNVYFKDREGKLSKIRLSFVDGILAFHHGWNIFVSDHLIKSTEFLLFEYTGKSTFFVRIFGRDSRERLHFDVGRKSEGVRKKEIHTNMSHDDLILIDGSSEDNENDYYFSGEYPRSNEPELHHVTAHTTEDPKRVERMVRSGLVPLDTRNGDVVIRSCRTQDMSSLNSKEKRVILIMDSKSSIHENDAVKLLTSTADSTSRHVAADMKEDPKRVQSGTEKGRLTDVVCGTKCTSPKCSEEKAASSCENDRTKINHTISGKGTCAFIELQPALPIKNLSSPDKISNCGDSRTVVNDDIDGKGTIAKLKTKMHLEPMGSIVGIQSTNIPVCANNTAAHQSEHFFFKQKDTYSTDFFTPAKPEILRPVRPEILGSDDPSLLKVNMQFCVPNTTQKWLELPQSLSNTVKGRKQDPHNVIILKDPMTRLWPVFYHESSIFVGFTAGWKPFATANNLQTGDLCELFKEPGDEEAAYSVKITTK